MTTDLNDRIAIAKGWARIVTGNQLAGVFIFWRNPEGKSAHRPNFVGTLEGLAGMLRELYEHDSLWEIGFITINDGLQCCLYRKDGSDRYYWAPWSRLGDCVGEAYLSVFGKEIADAV